MMKRRLLLGLLLCLLPLSAAAVEPPKTARFEQVMRMNMAELTAEVESVLARDYGTVDWQSYHFPDYAKIAPEVLVSYRIAVLKPELLAGIAGDPSRPSLPCYCSCEQFGHKSLLDCFVKEGSLENGFDEHGSQCNICCGQAMLAFLWQDAGASQAEILAGMQVKFARLLEIQNKEQSSR